MLYSVPMKFYLSDNMNNETNPELTANEPKLPNKNTLKITPEPTLRRLPRYLHLLYYLREEGVEDLSSTTIAEKMKLDPTQVRKDIQYTSITGKPKTGFKTSELIAAIEEYLNWNHISNSVLFGAGSLGTAILGYKRFREIGLNFIAAFDSDPSKVGSSVKDIPVLPIENLFEIVKNFNVEIAVLTVPVNKSQDIADIIVNSGIKAIWNFTPTHLQVPDSVVVENAQLSQSLALLTRRLAEKVESDIIFNRKDK